MESKDIKVNKTENESNKLLCSSCVVALSLFLYAWVCLWSVMQTSEACDIDVQGKNNMCEASTKACEA